MATDERSFRVNFSGDGVSRLRETVKKKLNEYMGDYTDDILVDYVIVLLRNGRQKEEAEKELNVFLEDDSISFVSWLWDHLSSNLNLYMQSSPSLSAEQTQLNPVNGQTQQGFDNEIESLSKSSRSRHNREWKNLVQEESEPLLLRSIVHNELSPRAKISRRHSPVRHSPPPKPQSHKRRRGDEPVAKREIMTRPLLDAPRRLLQFAVRDAVRTVQQTTFRIEPSSKRLRSVVSSNMDTCAIEKNQSTRSLANTMGTMTTAIKAAAEAAEDVKVKCPVNVFERLGHKNNKAELSKLSSEFRRDGLGEDREVLDQVSKHLDYYKEGDIAMIDRDNVIASDSESDYDDYGNVGNLRSTVGEVSQSASFVLKGNSQTVQYTVSPNENVMAPETTLKEQSPLQTAPTHTSTKTVKPQNYEMSKKTKAAAGYQISLDGNKGDVGKKQAHFPKTTNGAIFGTNNETVGSGDAPKDVHKSVPAHGSYSSSRPSEAVDSRIVFVSNVHFGATIDTLSRHFNKFGEVLKVIIVTDGATGQATGSAYVEFLRKESAELALSLNGTSFMSRILKVVPRGAATFEANATLSWPRTARVSSFAPRLARVSYARGHLASTFRGRFPVKPGARSLQWKRGSPGTPATNGIKGQSGNIVTVPTGRNLTYIRSETT